MRAVLKNKNITNSIWNMLDIFCYPVLFFCTTSVFINRMGVEQFGIWMLINTMILFMQMFNFGIGSSIFKEIAYFTSKGDDKSQIKLINNALSFIWLLAILCVLVGLLVAYMVESHDLFHIENSLKKLSAECILIGGVLVGLKFCEQIYSNYFKAKEQYRSAALISSGNRITAILLNMILLICFHISILQILIVIVIINSLFLILGNQLVKRDNRDYKFRFSLKFSKPTLQFAAYTWLQSLFIILTFQTDRLLIINNFGLAVLGYYALTATMFNHLHMGFNAILPWISPKLTKLYAKNLDGEDLYLAARNVLVSFSLATLLILSLIYPFLFHLILGPNTSQHIYLYTRYFILFESFFVLTIVPGAYFNAMGHEKVYLIYIVIFMMLTIAMMSIFLHLFKSPISVLYGLIISAMIGAFILQVCFCKLKYNKLLIYNSIQLLLPSFCIAIFTITDSINLKLLLAFFSILSIYGFYLKGKIKKSITLLSQA